MHLKDKIETLEKEALESLNLCKNAQDVETVKVKYLGKKGEVSNLMLQLKAAAQDQRPELGRLINELKNKLEGQISELSFCLSQKELQNRLSLERIDITLPARGRNLGREHIIIKTLNEAIDIFVGMGFVVQYGPDIESDYYNFEALNFAKDHPARDMQDSFYISDDLLLRTQTSNAQVRVMEASLPPIRVISPGKCYRNEDVSSRSHVLFHQIEVMYVDEHVTFVDLFTILEEFCKKFFSGDIKMRYRPSYFPFVEPGMEVDVNCFLCSGKGCSVCKHSGWLEICGSGMIHPNVLKAGGIDPEKYIGYAIGMGIERLAMLRHGIFDIRLFLENDLRFLQQF